MLKLFRKNSSYKMRCSPVAEKAAGLLLKNLLFIHTKWANWMSIKEKKMTPRQKKQALVVFCLVFGLVAGYLLYNGLFGSKATVLKPPSVTFPIDTRLPDSLNLEYLRELYKQKTLQQTDSIHY